MVTECGHGSARWRGSVWLGKDMDIAELKKHANMVVGLQLDATVENDVVALRWW